MTASTGSSGGGRARRSLAAGLAATATLCVLPAGADAQIAPPTPIEHVVIVYQENHSFDNVLGQFCIQNARCDGAAEGLRPNGNTIPLAPSPDIVPPVAHYTSAQEAAVNGGRMDGFTRVRGCHAKQDFACYSQYDPLQIPNLSALAGQFVVSDRTFEMGLLPSWGAHLELVAQTLDGFLARSQPHTPDGSVPGPGWGCDSGKDAAWAAAAEDVPIQVPSCVPDPALDPAEFPFGGAYRETPVAHVPTIMDELDDAGLSWSIYAGDARGGHSGYGWAICPTFADCLYTSQHSNQVSSAQIIDDAAQGTLPAFSIAIPTGPSSQHNRWSMLHGDNWIGEVVSAIQSGPDWQSTAIFITYDDCGCFYDHVPPPPGLGIRVPMVIVSPYARPAFTDSNPASFSSMLAFTEHVLGLPPLAASDAAAYDYADSFDFSQAPQPPAPLASHRLPKSERTYIREHPPKDEAS